MSASLDHRRLTPVATAAQAARAQDRDDEPKVRAVAPPVAFITPALFTTPQAAAYLGMSEAKFHELRPEPWMCAPIVLGARLIRWARADLDSAIAAMPRQSSKPDEPAWLAQARGGRTKATGAPA